MDSILPVRQNPTLEVLQEALERPTHVLHFAGHTAFRAELGERYGTQEGIGNVLLCGADGSPFPFPAHKLALNLVRCGVRVALLNGSKSANRGASDPLSGLVQALAYAGIPAAIGFVGGLLILT